MAKSAPIDLSVPRKLGAVSIPKPWGREIWYTGMEARGESCVMVGAQRIPLSNYLALDPAATCAGTPVLLLKILDPSPTPVLGDLYFEVHAEKREVYVVTAIDAQAWPQGRGAIRFGMNQKVRTKMANDTAFVEAYLEAVTAYEALRRRIDAGAAGLEARERSARAHMESFTALQQLAVGDVVVVPTWTPHALQHGVRVVEFQTPTYERLILSFAQRVLTQDHWDTAQAVAGMSLEPPSTPVFEPVGPNIERIARFPDFNVWRAVATDEPIVLPDGLPYAVCIGVQGEMSIGALTLGAEEAAFIPAAGLATPIEPRGASLLVAAPGL